MDFFRAIILGVVQGTTEFLPISSSGHLVLVPWLLNWSEPGVVFDAMVHWGTLVAVAAYFRDDLSTLTRAWLASVRERNLNPDTSTQLSAGPQRRLAWLIVIGTIPIGLAGLLFEEFFEGLFGRPGQAAGLLLVTGLLLIASERWHRRQKTTGRGEASGRVPSCALEGSNPLASPLLTVAGALFIGLAQALAIAPGISRSGATIAAGLLIGLSRQESARFSFLLAMPAILGAGVLQLVDLMESGTALTQLPTLIIGFIAAGVTGYLAIRLLLDYLQRHTLNVFAIYCWTAGSLGLVVYWLRQ